MTRLRAIWLGLALIGVGLCGAPNAAHAQSAKFPLPPGSALTQENWLEVARVADFVVFGSVREVRGYFGETAFGPMIVSEVTVEVERSLRGKAASVLRFTTLGGTVDDLTLHVSSLRPLAVGERYLILTAANEREVQEIFGTDFGALTVTGGEDPTVSPFGVSASALEAALLGEKSR